MAEHSCLLAAYAVMSYFVPVKWQTLMLNWILFAAATEEKEAKYIQ